jgi:NhaP-type Na+/H+ or K+/H+ antiporter
MTDLSQGDIMLAAALVFGIATACQVIAPLLRVPALILLLPAGFLLGVVAPDLRVDQILGPVFPVAVELIVAVILFQGGLDLGTIPLRGSDKGVVRRLVWIGSPITWIAGTLVSHYVLGLEWPIAFLLGAILIVSGPTVVTPILNFARPEPRVRGILMWEGTLLDPIGAIFAVMIFQVISVTDVDRPLEAVVSLLTSWTVAILVGAGGVLLAVLGIKLSHANKFMGTQILIGSVLVAAGFANFLAEDSGLLAALIMGGSMHPLAKRLNTSLDEAVPFFNTVTQIGIGVLFVSIAAMVPSPILSSIVLPAIGASLIFIIIVRPIVAAIMTSGANLSLNERAFIGWMDPRGIVAAATASSLSAALIATKMPGADKLLPAAFVIITITVFVYGLTAVPVAKALGVQEKTPTPD